MAQKIESHTHKTSSTSSRLPTLSEKARNRAQVLRQLADDLDLHEHKDAHGNARLVAVMGILLDGAGAELSGGDLDFLRRLDVGSLLPLDGVRPTEDR